MTASELTPSEFEIISHYEKYFADDALWAESTPELENEVVRTISSAGEAGAPGH